jgi:hypothetical protein
VNGQLQYSIYDPATNIWTKSLKAGGALYSGPSCVKLPGGKVLCVARSASGGLTSSVFDGVAWGPFVNVAGSVISRPGCATDEAGGVVCAVINPGNGLSAIRYAGTSWGAFTSIGGVAGSDDVRCSTLQSSAPYRLSCLVTGTNGVVYINSFTGTLWAGWFSLGLQTSYGATCGVTVSGQFSCGAVATADNAFYSTTWNGSAWSAWAKVGGTGIGTPSCAGLGTGKVACVFAGVDNKTYYSVGP